MPFNIRIQLSGSDLKNQVEERSTDQAQDDTDHDIQELVAVEDKQTKKYDDKSSRNKAADEGQTAAKQEHRSSQHDRQQDNSIKQEKQKPKVNFKVHGEGIEVGVSSDFWNNYKQDVKLAEDLGQATV